MLLCFKTINLPYGPLTYHIFIASFIKRELLGRCWAIILIKSEEVQWNSHFDYTFYVDMYFTYI